MSKNNNKNYQNQNNNQKPTLTEEQLKAKMAFAENMIPKETSEAKPEEIAPVVEGAVETTETKTEVTQPVEGAPVNEEVKVEAPAEEVPSEPEQVTQEEASEVEDPVVVDEEKEKQETHSPVIPSIPDSKKLVIADKGRFTNEEIIAKLKKVGLSAAVDQNDNIVIAIYTNEDGDRTVLNPFIKRVLAAGFKTVIVDNTPSREN